MRGERSGTANKADHHDKTSSAAKSARSAAPPVHSAMELQNAIGNRALGRLMSTRAAKPAASPVAVSPAANIVQRKCAACSSGGPECPACEEEQLMIQRKAGPGGEAPTSDETLRNLGSGQPLDRASRNSMESRFGHDFGQVRVHTDTKAAKAADSLRAHAFTMGQDIYFGAGFRPDTAAGQHLLAHELTHTLQQRAGAATGRRSFAQSRPLVSRPQDPLEQEADAVADRVLYAMPAGAISTDSASAPLVQRYSWDEFVGDVEGTAESVGSAIVGAGEAVADGVSSAGQIVAEGVQSAGQIVAQGVQSAGQVVAEGIDIVTQAISEGIEIVGGAAGAAAAWLRTAAGSAALAIARRLVGAIGGTITVTPAGIVVTLPPISLFPSTNPTLIDFPPEGFFIPIPGLAAGGFIGPFPVVAMAGILGYAQPQLVAAIGPGVIRNVRFVIDPATNHYLATGQAYIAAAVGPRVALFGGLAAFVGTAFPMEPPIPLIASIEGGLRGTGTGWEIRALQRTVTLEYLAGALRFSDVYDLMIGILLQGDLDLWAALRLEGIDVCHYAYRLGHWEVGDAYRISLPITAGYGPGGPSFGIGPITHGPIPISAIATAIKPPPEGWKCSTLEEIWKMICDLGALPPELCPPNAPAPGGMVPPAPGVVPLRNQLAMAICKCVGDAKCGGGQIHKKCFTVEDNVCKEKGALQKAADDLCNHDPEMVAKCDRTEKKCRYRHTDAKCPVKEEECPSSSTVGPREDKSTCDDFPHDSFTKCADLPNHKYSSATEGCKKCNNNDSGFKPANEWPADSDDCKHSKHISCKKGKDTGISIFQCMCCVETGSGADEIKKFKCGN